LKNCDKMQKVMESFQPHEIAYILHIMVKKQYTTCFVPELERRAEAISWEFNSPEVAKGDCDDEETAGGADVGQLERRTEAIMIRGVQVARGCRRVVGVCDDRDKGGGADDGAAGAAGGGAEAISGELKSQEVANTMPGAAAG
jgi:hypothetical protein